MKRFFSFGCSFTRYPRWPTWADAVGKHFDFYENWGICGAGNQLIMNSLIECHQRSKITSKDTVYVMWTNTSREDRYVGNRWLAQGNVYWDKSLPGEYVKRFACERGYLIRDLAAITSSWYLLQYLGCDFKFLSMVPLNKTNESLGLGSAPLNPAKDNQDVIDLYQDVLNQIRPSVFEQVFNNDWNSRPGIPDSNQPDRRDFHPTPCEHLEYLDKVCPDLVLDSAIVDWMVSCEEIAKQNNLTWTNPGKLTNRL